MGSNSDLSTLLNYRDSIYSRDLLICATVHFNLFTYMVQKKISFDVCCKELNIRERPTCVMRSLFVSMGLLEIGDNGDYYPSDNAAQYLNSESENTLVPYFASLKNRPQCLEFREVLLSDKPSGWSSKKSGQDWITSMRDPEFADQFTKAMDSRGTFLANELAERIDLSNYHSLLDIGGASGIYACTFSKKNPHLRSSVLEIVPVDEAAQRALKTKGMEHAVTVIRGDMFEAIPEGYDIHLLSNTLHDWSVESNRAVIANSFKSISFPCCIIVFNAHLNDDLHGPLSVAEYSCLLMHSTEGRCYTKKEIRELLSSVGFMDIKELNFSTDRSAIIALKK